MRILWRIMEDSHQGFFGGRCWIMGLLGAIGPAYTDSFFENYGQSFEMFLGNAAVFEGYARTAKGSAGLHTGHQLAMETSIFSSHVPDEIELTQLRQAELSKTAPAYK